MFDYSPCTRILILNSLKLDEEVPKISLQGAFKHPTPKLPFLLRPSLPETEFQRETLVHLFLTSLLSRLWSMQAAESRNCFTKRESQLYVCLSNLPSECISLSRSVAGSTIRACLKFGSITLLFFHVPVMLIRTSRAQQSVTIPPNGEMQLWFRFLDFCGLGRVGCPD